MTQRLSDNVVEMLVNPAAPLAAQKAATDLLSLRAAVRRVLEADAAYVSTEDRPAVLRFHREMRALRAEMGGIDKDGGA